MAEWAWTGPSATERFPLRGWDAPRTGNPGYGYKGRPMVASDQAAGGLGFRSRVVDALGAPLRARRIGTLMLNVGLRCTMACAHCHHSCSPDRTQAMDVSTIDRCIRLACTLRPELVDITGGAPELHPELARLVSSLSDERIPVRVRTNLAVLSLPEHAHLFDVFTRAEVRLLASLPGPDRAVVDAQRGAGAFESSLRTLRALNERGYGDGTGLVLELAYNPPAGALPEPQASVEQEIRESLARHGVRFDRLLVIANVPVGRLAAALRTDGSLDAYRQALRDAFNEDTLPELCCTTGIEVAWDGTLWDCDFNLAAGVDLAEGPRHIRELDTDPGPGLERIVRREVAVAEHCFACTAGAGSS